jgi:DNA-binding NarL/FixJ family response regulator
MSEARTPIPARIVVVDDEIIMREMLRMMFERSDEFDLVATCGSATESLRVLREDQIDAVLLDLGLPGVTGTDVIAEIALLDDPPRILVVSGRDDADAVRSAREAGADGYVVKGDPRRIVEALRRVVRGERVVDLGRGTL